MKILRMLGFKDFLRLNDILTELKEIDSTQDFSKKQHLLFIKSPVDRLWMIGSKTHVFFVFDNGIKLDVIKKISKLEKNSIKFDVKSGTRYAKIIFENSPISIPFDTDVTGGTQSVISIFKQFLNE